MFKNLITGVIATMVVAMPALAQERGTMEFGVFGSYTKYDDALGLNNAPGFGGRIGTFLDPRWFVEFEGGVAKATRDGGLPDVNVSVQSARLGLIPMKIGPVQVLLAAGMDHTDTFVLESYGWHALLGGKIMLSERYALRGDLINSWLSNGGGQNLSAHVGLALFRQPAGRETTVYQTTTVPAPAQMAHSDSVSAMETRRLRADAAALIALRDSLARNRPVTMDPSSVTALATMLEMINFDREKSDLDDVSRAILRDKVPIFVANPQMRIVITGYASSPGTDAYNTALGYRRAVAAKAYLVSQGVAADRIEIATRGENDLLVAGPGDVANAANRRGQFRLLIADPYLVKP